MKPKDIQAGMSCTVAWFHVGGQMGIRRDYLASGKIVFRRAGEIKFQWESGEFMDSDFPGWPAHSCEFFRVNVRDIKSINGLSISECADMTKEQVISHLTP